MPTSQLVSDQLVVLITDVRAKRRISDRLTEACTQAREEARLAYDELFSAEDELNKFVKLLTQ